MLVLSIISLVKLDQCNPFPCAQTSDGKPYTAGGLTLSIAIVDMDLGIAIASLTRRQNPDICIFRHGVPPLGELPPDLFAKLLCKGQKIGKVYLAVLGNIYTCIEIAIV